jgi:uncharacterized repeat protein (TIGR01451 family)
MSILPPNKGKPVPVNRPATYQITIRNKGKVKAVNTRIVVDLPEQLKVVKASEPAKVLENIVRWELKDLDPGSSRFLELTLETAQVGEWCFKATLHADPNVNQAAKVCTEFVGLAGMTLQLFDREDPIFRGDKNSYPLVIRNQGTAPLTNIRVKAFIPETLKFERAEPTVETRSAAKGGEWVQFAVVPAIAAGAQAQYEVFVQAVQAGVTKLHVEVLADHLEQGGPVIEEELTTIADERSETPIQPLK